MSLGSFLKKVGVDLEKVAGVGAEAAEVAEPVVDVLFPEVATLFNSAVNEALKLLTAAQTAAAAGSGTTAQLANVAAAVEPALITYLQGQGLPAPTAAQVNAYTQSLLQSLATLVAIENGTLLPSTNAAPSDAGSTATVQAATSLATS